MVKALDPPVLMDNSRNYRQACASTYRTSLSRHEASVRTCRRPQSSGPHRGIQNPGGPGFYTHISASDKLTKPRSGTSTTFGRQSAREPKSVKVCQAIETDELMTNPIETPGPGSYYHPHNYNPPKHHRPHSASASKSYRKYNASSLVIKSTTPGPGGYDPRFDLVQSKVMGVKFKGVSYSPSSGQPHHSSVCASEYYNVHVDKIGSSESGRSTMSGGWTMTPRFKQRLNYRHSKAPVVARQDFIARNRAAASQTQEEILGRQQERRETRRLKVRNQVARRTLALARAKERLVTRAQRRAKRRQERHWIVLCIRLWTFRHLADRLELDSRYCGMRKGLGLTKETLGLLTRVFRNWHKAVHSSDVLSFEMIKAIRMIQRNCFKWRLHLRVAIKQRKMCIIVSFLESLKSENDLKKQIQRFRHRMVRIQAWWREQKSIQDAQHKLLSLAWQRHERKLRKDFAHRILSNTNLITTNLASELKEIPDQNLWQRAYFIASPDGVLRGYECLGEEASPQEGAKVLVEFKPLTSNFIDTRNPVTSDRGKSIMHLDAPTPTRSRRRQSIVQQQAMTTASYIICYRDENHFGQLRLVCPKSKDDTQPRTTNQDDPMTSWVKKIQDLCRLNSSTTTVPMMGMISPLLLRNPSMEKMTSTRPPSMKQPPPPQQLRRPFSIGKHSSRRASISSSRRSSISSSGPMVFEPQEGVLYFHAQNFMADMPKCRENIRREALLANVKQRKKHYLALRESYFLTKKRWDHLQSQIQENNLLTDHLRLLHHQKVAQPVAPTFTIFPPPKVLNRMVLQGIQQTKDMIFRRRDAVVMNLNEKFENPSDRL